MIRNHHQSPSSSRRTTVAISSISNEELNNNNHHSMITRMSSNSTSINNNINNNNNNNNKNNNNDNDMVNNDNQKSERYGSSPLVKVNRMMDYVGCMSSMRLFVLVILCLQNSMFTLLRRYSLGNLKEKYSKYEVLLVAEFLKIAYCIYMINGEITNSGTSGGSGGGGTEPNKATLQIRLKYLLSNSSKMLFLALIYGAMNILSFVALRNIGAGMFTIFAQCKILSTAVFSTILLKRQYSWTKWRALIALMLGALLFSQPMWESVSGNITLSVVDADGNMPLLGTAAVVIEVTLSGFASIYFEKVIKKDPLQLNIWERNFQLGMGSVFVYIVFIMFSGNTLLYGWSFVAFTLSALGAAGGLLVALSIKYGDSILKTLATTSAILLSSVLDHFLLGGPLTPIMVIAAILVIIAICDYTFDATPPPSTKTSTTTPDTPAEDAVVPAATTPRQTSEKNISNQNDEELALMQKTNN